MTAPAGSRHNRKGNEMNGKHEKLKRRIYFDKQLRIDYDSKNGVVREVVSGGIKLSDEAKQHAQALVNFVIEARYRDMEEKGARG
jgi:hypothetical protein